MSGAEVEERGSGQERAMWLRGDGIDACAPRWRVIRCVVVHRR